MDGDATGRPRVVILGGGFAGVGAAMRLAASPVDVVLIDRHHYRTFQPLLYQLATGMLEPGAVGEPLQRLTEHQPNTTVRQGAVESVDLAGHAVHVDDMPPIPYDYLVYALGVEADFSDTEGAPENAFPVYTLPGALRLRDHLAALWASADCSPALVADGALNVVVAGAGATGVEVAGAVAELYRHRFAHEYPRVAERDARVILVEKGDRLLPQFGPEMRSYAMEALADETVDVVTGQAVIAVSPTRVALTSGREIKAHTLIWSTGVRATTVTRSVGIALGETGRIVTGPSLGVPGHPEVFAVGDAAAITHSGSPDLLPQLGTVALQSGQHAGETIARMVAGEAPLPFGYSDHRPMLTIGRDTAGMQLPDGGAVTGRRAQLAWLTAHLGLLRTSAPVDHSVG
ncbi:NAD(P)/FAD-dependent oxidoreductase [Microbacterium sp. ASV49]|uniref:FAD-dependent oxidoreductase n=1 Tax=Microbacterium candidum TaxID=3041922 RepID=A0ABT7MYJ8_9MICO|nr:FAD-dependent oxidoreductase [Microbacterium sp. ASV49]MDL9979533.1 FAD-dependent oxidoreductase [Microbacterium sp. ASV49]